MSTGVQTRPSGPRRSKGTASSGLERLVAALPVALLAAIFAFFMATRTSEALTALDSARAVLIIAGIVVGWVLARFALRRFVPKVWIRSAVLCAVGLLLGVVLVRPYYVSTTDNTQLVKGPIQQRSATSGTNPSALSPVSPVRVSTGQLRGLGHTAAGDASFIRQPDGSYVLRLSNFNIQGTPDPHVYVVQGEDRRSLDSAVELATLRGNVGMDSDYVVPNGTQPGAGWTVLVWCKAFDTPIANATQVAT